MAGESASDKRAQLHRDLRHARQARRRFAASVQSQLVAGPHNEMSPPGFSHITQVKSLELTAVARSVPEQPLDEDSFCDEDKYSSNRREKIFVDYEAAHHYFRVMFESQLASLVAETANLYGLVRRAQSEEEACHSIAVEVSAPKLDMLDQAVDRWTKDLNAYSDELEYVLSCWTCSTNVEEHYIGSDEDDPADAGGACLLSAAAFEPSFECGDLVCLRMDFETHAGRILRQGTQGRVCDVHQCDEMPLVMVEFLDTHDYVGVSDRDLVLQEKAEWPSGLQIVP